MTKTSLLPESSGIRTALIEKFDARPVLRRVAPPAVPLDRVVVAMRAAALNFADLLKAEGQYQERADPPFIPGLEGAGEVLSAPDGSGFVPGDRVAVLAPGTMADRISVGVDDCIAIPAGMTFAQAAGFQITYGTSHLALTHCAALRPGETLAVLGAAGGVGSSAVQLGHALGARVIGVARGPERLQTVREAGADHVIDSADGTDLKTSLRDLGGVDVVYDAIGGNAGEAAFRALRPLGRFLVIGFAAGKPPVLLLNHALVKNVSIHGFYWGGYASLNRSAVRSSMIALFAMFDRGQIRPVLGQVMPLERVAEAFDLLRGRAAAGKIVLTM